MLKLDHYLTLFADMLFYYFLSLCLMPENDNFNDTSLFVKIGGLLKKLYI